MPPLFIGSYWSSRPESKDSAALRMEAFLSKLLPLNADFETWYEKGRGRRSAMKSVVLPQMDSIAKALNGTRNDLGAPMTELGFGLEVWNGKNTSLSACVGASSPHVRNCVVLTCWGNEVDVSGAWLCDALREMILAFDPEFGAVSSIAHMDAGGARYPWEFGLFTYRRGEPIRSGPLP